MSVRTVAVKLQADVAQYVTNMRRASDSTKSFGQRLNEAASTGKLDAIADRAGVMGIALGGAAGYAVKQFMDFDKQMSAVQAATKATAGDMEKLRAAALQAGADTKYSATEAAKGIEELAKAGVSTQNILGGGLSGALSLAAAGELDVGEAAELAASAMTQFKLKGGDLPHVADLLAAAAGKAQGSVHDMGQALNQAGLVASQTGLSIEDTTGTLAAFASAGLLGSDAGTSFKQMLLMLQAPSAKTAELMKDLGISAYDSTGQFVGITNLAQQLKEKLGTLTPELRANAMAQIFGADATRAASILYEQGAAGIQEWIDKTNDAGYAAETARIKTDNLAGDLERLKGSIETLAIQAGSAGNGPLRGLVQILDELVDSISNLPPVVSQSMAVLAGVGGAALLAGAGWVKMRRSTAETLEELRATGPAGERAAKGLQRVGSAAGKAAAGLAALQAVNVLVASFQDDLNPQIDALALGLGKWAGGAKLSGEASRVLGADMDDLKDKFKFLADEDNNRRMAVKHLQGAFEGIIPGLAGANESLAKTKERITAVDQSLAQMVNGGSPAQARQVFDELTKQLAVQGVSIDEVKKQFPQYAAALEVAGSSADGAATATGAVTAELEAAKKAADEAREAFDKLFENYMSADEAALKYSKTLASTNKELSSGTATLSLNSEEGIKNRQAMLDLVDAVNDQRTANLNNGMSLDVADAKYKQQIGSLITTSTRLGFTKADVEKLIGKYRDLPATATTKVGTSGVPAVNAALDDLLIKQRALQQGLSYSAAKAAQQKDADRNRQRAYATGGWTGPGSKWTEAGIVHADEFVVSKESRGALEEQRPGALDYMNRTGQWPEYATGGRVTWPFPVTAKKAKIPSEAQVMAAVSPPAGRTSDWIVAVARALVPGIRVLSKDRPGARTLSGNRSYHALGRAVDFEPSEKLARLWDERYRARTRELISPYQRYNIHNGGRHTYTGAVWNQHNFAGGNAHDHIAMAGGGIIREPILGVGASGKTYSFGEGYRPETVTPGAWQNDHGAAGAGGGTVVQITVNVSPTANRAEIGREVVGAIQAYETRSGSSWRN